MPDHIPTDPAWALLLFAGIAVMVAFCALAVADALTERRERRLTRNRHPSAPRVEAIVNAWAADARREGGQ